MVLNKKAIMFCNKSFADAKVKDTRSNYYLYDQGESIYLNYDIEAIGKSLLCFGRHSVGHAWESSLMEINI